MRKLYLTLICLIALAASQASMAQNMTQLEAIKNLTGFWTTIPTDNVPQSTLNFENHSNPAQRYLTTTGFASKSYNTYNFSTGVIQATNSDPSLNDNYNYRNLTPTTCEFRINGYWVNAQKGRSGQQTNTPTNNYHPINNVATPANNNRPSTNVVRPANNNNNNYRPTNNNGQYKDGSDLQLTTPPDVPATLAPSNNNSRPTGNTPTPTNNNSQTQTENNNGRVVIDNNHHAPATNSNNNVTVVFDNNYTPPTHRTAGQEGTVTYNATTPADNNTDNNSNNNQRRSNRKRNVQINKSSSNNSSSNPVKSRRSAGRR